MTRIEVTCDICREVVMPPDRKIATPFIGFEFDSVKRPFSLRVADENKVARHICGHCLKALADLYALTRTVWLVGKGVAQ